MRSTGVLQQIRRLFTFGPVSGLTEWELLVRYIERHDEAAFAALVARHGAMVLGVCRRMLPNPDDVEDAFQATFVVLVRKARTIRPNEPVGPWLYGVAHRVALRARSDVARRRRERPVSTIPDFTFDIDAHESQRDLELSAVLDEEIRRLPERYRAAIVLCYLEGRSHEEAAGQLGWPLGTVKGRLARARDLLRGRLARRGLAPSIASLAAFLAREADASVPLGWVETTIRAAMRLIAKAPAAGTVSATASALSAGVLQAMVLNQVKTAAAALVLLAAIVAGAGAFARQDRPAERSSEAAPRRTDQIASTGQPSTPSDREKKAVPQAEARSDERDPGLRLSKRDNSVAARGFEIAFEGYRAGKVDAETVYLWSTRLMDYAQSPPNAISNEQALEDHRKRMEQLEQVAKHRNEAHPNNATLLERLNTRFYVEQAGAPPQTPAQGRGSPVVMTTPNGALEADGPAMTLGGAKQRSDNNAETEPGNDPRSRAVLKKLDEVVAMNFAGGTPLEEVLKHVKAFTQSAEFPNGLAIYVDPIGLQEAEKTLSSAVTIDLDGVPLRRTLYLALRQLGLVYLVEDGMIYITNQGSENYPLPPPMPTLPSPFGRMQERAERGEMTEHERKAFIEVLKDLQQIHELQYGPNGLFSGRDSTRRFAPPR
jgi:RNA polymerase sigma factor (sigma-70 family)